jgi:hypothetical protein
MKVLFSKSQANENQEQLMFTSSKTLKIWANKMLAKWNSRLIKHGYFLMSAWTNESSRPLNAE